MPSLQTGAECVIKINQQQIRHSISSVELKQFIDTHHVLRVRIAESRISQRAGEFTDIKQFTDFLGATISLSLQSSGGVVDASEALEFEGIVTAVNLESAVDSVEQVVIEAHSPTILMDQNRTKRFFLEMSPADIINQVTGSYRVTMGSAPSIGGVSLFTLQYQETDYELIRRYGTGAGFFVYYDGKELQMKEASGIDAVELKFRENLGSFKAGLGTAALGYYASAWNHTEKKLVSSEKRPSDASAGGIASASFKASKETYTSMALTGPRSAGDMSSVDTSLETEQKAALARMIKCSGESVMPSVVVGRAVAISGVGDLDGQYFITEVTHTLDDSGVYGNSFTCLPMEVAFPQRFSRPCTPDVENAIVCDNCDEEKQGRVKVIFPWQSDSTDWLRVITPEAGPERGLFVLPEIDDEVLVIFEHGNVNSPVVIGSMWNGNDVPPTEGESDQNNIRLFKTKGGHLLLFDDTSGSETLKIMQPDGKNSLVMELGGPSLTIESEGDIAIKGKTISLETTGGDFTVKSGGKGTFEATSDLELKGMNLKAEGSVNAEIKAGAMGKVDGGGMLEVKGTMVKIN